MKILTRLDILNLSKLYELSPALVEAVATTESAGSGFYLNEGQWKGELKVLFEGHYFYKFTNGKYAISNPTLCYKHWTKVYYRRGQEEFTRFMEALKLDKKSALLSTSWGKFQIMGANYEDCGYSSVEQMITDFYRGEDKQLTAFFNYCTNRKSKLYKCNLLELLRKFDTSKDDRYLKEFTALYNGKGQIEYYTNKIIINYSKVLKLY